MPDSESLMELVMIIVTRVCVVFIAERIRGVQSEDQCFSGEGAEETRRRMGYARRDAMAGEQHP